MDADIDFIRPEFLDILFLEQKSLILYPYIDLKNLHILDVFALDNSSVDLDATMLHNFEDIVKIETIELNSQQKTIFFIYNVKIEEINIIMNIKDIHCIINTNEDIKGLSDINNDFILYNKKTNRFLNYHTHNSDLDFASHLISSSENVSELRLQLRCIKYTGERIFQELNKNPESAYLTTLLKDYDSKYWAKIINYTQKYYHITIPDLVPTLSPKLQAMEKKPRTPYDEEFEFIHNLNPNLSHEFLLLLHEYRTKKVNSSNLDLEELYFPERLYAYLRTHHWKDDIDLEFLKEWIQMPNTNYILTDQDFEDFKSIYEKINVCPEKIIQLIEYKPKRKEKLPVENIIKEKHIATTPKIKQIPISIPSLKNFSLYKKWVLSTLDEIDKLLDQ
jgi:hypothetical protein